MLSYIKVLNHLSEGTLMRFFPNISIVGVVLGVISILVLNDADSRCAV